MFSRRNVGTKTLEGCFLAGPENVVRRGVVVRVRGPSGRAFDAGLPAIQLEDREFPKKCGHTPFKRLIPPEDMVEKIKVAVNARMDKENFLIIARTDARQSEGVEGVLRRLEAYAYAGADVLFPEALTSKDETLRRAQPLTNL